MIIIIWLFEAFKLTHFVSHLLIIKCVCVDAGFVYCGDVVSFTWINSIRRTNTLMNEHKRHIYFMQLSFLWMNW